MSFENVCIGLIMLAIAIVIIVLGRNGFRQFLFWQRLNWLDKRGWRIETWFNGTRMTCGTECSKNGKRFASQGYWSGEVIIHYPMLPLKQAIQYEKSQITAL